MKKIYNKNAREKQLLEEAYGAIYERRNPDADEWGGGMKGPFAAIQRGPKDEEEEHDEYHPGYGKVKEHGHDKTGGMSDKALLASVEKKGTAGDALLRAAHERIRQGESLTPHERDALARDQYGYHGEDEEANVNWDEDKEVDEVGGGMNAKEFNTINKTTPL
tara:strand:+ start:88 stop:576 length:489 start_codon:yes stop_codon:yes gene_type:complete